MDWEVGTGEPPINDAAETGAVGEALGEARAAAGEPPVEAGMGRGEAPGEAGWAPVGAGPTCGAPGADGLLTKPLLGMGDTAHHVRHIRAFYVRVYLFKACQTHQVWYQPRK